MRSDGEWRGEEGKMEEKKGDEEEEEEEGENETDADWERGVRDVGGDENRDVEPPGQGERFSRKEGSGWVPATGKRDSA